MISIILLIIPFVIFFINLIFRKHKFLMSHSGEAHQLFIGKKNVPLSAGIIIFLYLLIIFVLKNTNTILIFFLFFIFCIGIISDLRFLNNAKLRLLLQSVTIYFFI